MRRKLWLVFTPRDSRAQLRAVVEPFTKPQQHYRLDNVGTYFQLELKLISGAFLTNSFYEARDNTVN